MNATVIGLDGKKHPRHKTIGDERLRIIGTEHMLFHQGKSVRQIQDILAKGLISRSVGTIHADLTKWQCSQCSGGAYCSPEQHDEIAGGR
ncbi:hypothetical protein [Pseudoclavibacter sp. CFCC 13611]|uniref:hypothetical protein n=1 Tax=Pseudoclavibacter sp. CFCC 13611 TaxID=2615178 RepID=UPI0013016773|nr:hypothetical protein [Pseudoclavibacter sp. CFCC 13611]KAB1662927.1 hypothetical protein F8O08_10260 [Pseudoclavibacter sp. CFCC 13611]